MTIGDTNVEKYNKESKKAIVNSGIRKLIGELDKRSSVPGEFVTVFKAYELRSDMFLVPTQQGQLLLAKTTLYM
jgi:hypothetical protein